MVEVRNPASSAMVATNFTNGIAVNQTAEMEVRMTSIDSEVTANVTSTYQEILLFVRFTFLI